MSSGTVVGIDLGTTTVKAAVFDLENPAAPLSVGSRPTPRVEPVPGHFEIDSEALMSAIVESVQSALGAAPAGVDPAAIGISGTACGAWLIDGDGVLTRRPIMWNDGRAAGITAGWVQDGTMSEIFRISGNVTYPGYSLPLLRWLRENEPSSLDRAEWILCQKDWVRMRLTGAVGQDETDGSYVPFDVAARGWSSELAAICGVADDAESLLPEIAVADDVAELEAGYAELLGLSRGTPVSVGLTDVVAATVGGGALAPGRAVTNLGTSAFSTIVLEAPELEPSGLGLTAASPLGRWMRTMVNTSGSMTLDFVASLVAEDDVGRMLELAGTAEPGAGGVALVPYLSPAGVVSPVVDPNARATIGGLRAGMGRAELARAAVEGLAAAISDCYELIPAEVEEISVVGGATRSDLVVQQIADFTQTPVRRLTGDEFGCRGAALLAAWAAGLLGGGDAELDELAAAVSSDRVFEPGQPPFAQMERYRALASATQPIWRGWR